jgi:hypothetical protein
MGWSGLGRPKRFESYREGKTKKKKKKNMFVHKFNPHAKK